MMCEVSNFRPLFCGRAGGAAVAFVCVPPTSIAILVDGRIEGLWTENNVAAAIDSFLNLIDRPGEHEECGPSIVTIPGTLRLAIPA